MQEKYWASKIPVWLVLLFLLNIFLVMGLELLFFYDQPAFLNEGVMQEKEVSWVSGTVLSSDEGQYLNAYLTGDPGGEIRMVVLKRHGIIPSRGKVVYNEPIPQQSGTQVIPVKVGIRTSEVTVEDSRTVSITFESAMRAKEGTTVYMVLAALLETLELMVVHFIKNRLQ